MIMLTLPPLRELYAESPGQIFETSLGVAEMVKYVCNAFHALKVTFANEIGTLLPAVGCGCACGNEDLHVRYQVEYLPRLSHARLCVRWIVLTQRCPRTRQFGKAT